MSIRSASADLPGTPAAPPLENAVNVAPGGAVPDEPTLSAEVVGDKVGRGLGWSFLNNFVSRLGSVLAGVVLARILLPEDYGVFAVGLVVLNAILSMNELGVSLAVVRWPTSVERIAPTVSTLAIVSSVLLYALCYTAAPYVAETLNAPAATGVIRLLSVCVLVDAIASVPAALITRGFQQRKRMAIDVSSFVIGTSVSISLALTGHGAWSMAWGFVVANVVSGALTIVLAPQRFRPGFDRTVAQELLSFGLPLAASSLLLFAMLNLDYIVVGHQLGPAQLGFYLLAFNVCSWPVTLVSAAMRRVSLAGFSRLTHRPDQLSEAFASTLGFVLALTLPLGTMLALYSGSLVAFVYGDKWSPAADALRLLCVLAVSRVLVELAYDYLVAVARARANLLLQGLWVCLLLPTLVLGARWNGIAGVAAGHALVAAMVMLPAYALVLRNGGVSLRRIARYCVRPVLGAGLVAVTAVPVTMLVDDNFAQLALGGVAGGLVYLVVVAPMRGLIRSGGLLAESPTRG